MLQKNGEIKMKCEYPKCDKPATCKLGLRSQTPYCKAHVKIKQYEAVFGKVSSEKEFNFNKKLEKIYSNYTKGKFDGIVFIKKIKELHKKLFKLLKEEIKNEEPHEGDHNHLIKRIDKIFGVRFSEEKLK